MNKIKSKKVHIAIVVMALLFLTGGYFAHSFMGANNDDANISKASAKTDAIKETDASEQKKAQKDKKYVFEDDSLKVTVTDVDVSGKTFKQVKKEMQEEAKEWRSDGREGIEYLRERSKNVIQM